MSTTDFCNPFYVSSCLAAVPKLQVLTEAFNRNAEDPAISLEQRYELVMSADCYGRIQALFKELDMPLHFGDLTPRILGHEACLHLIGEEIVEKLNVLSSLMPEPA